MLLRVFTVVGVAVVHLAILLLFLPAPRPTPVPRPLKVTLAAAVPPRPVPRPASASPTVPEPSPPVSEQAGLPSASEPPAEPAPTAAPPAEPAPSPAPRTYRPADQATTPPVLPTDAILAAIRYPEGARKRKVQATVVLELWIDEAGTIERVDVASDPGWGFAEAAVKALAGVHAQPALWGEQPVAVRYRYPVRFLLK